MPYLSHKTISTISEKTWKTFTDATFSLAEIFVNSRGWPDTIKGTGNYVYTTDQIIPQWTSEPRYHTIHNLCKDVFEVTDEQAAKICSFLEFYRRVGGNYETHKAHTNGDVYGDVPYASKLVKRKGS